METVKLRLMKYDIGHMLEYGTGKDKLLIGSIIFNDATNLYRWHHYRTQRDGEVGSVDEAREKLVSIFKELNDIPEDKE